MGWFIISRALVVRILFAFHGFLTIYLLTVVSEDPNHWYATTSLTGLLLETGFTIYVRKGQEWKWFCPSVLFYLLSVVPPIWLLELHELEERIMEELIRQNSTNVFHNVSDDEQIADLLDKIVSVFGELNHIKTPDTFISQALNLINQARVHAFEIPRWILPKGQLTHDQLSELLLVYIATAADIVEFFDAFKEDAVRFNRPLCIVILSIWSWSLLQFTMVLTATKKPKDTLPPPVKLEPCFTPEVFGIVISMFLQDAPFLVLRLLLIFQYDVVSYTNMFFTCKNTLVCMLLTYRLVVIQIESRRSEISEKPSVQLQ
ncbi:hypothetical protein HELRODRAFT_156957 [Helobdella robusta]|uniref:Transmembrane protein 26 n=1 Tax=Helobdella robusta TaxID=6412 RepID=T1EM41_HELRO|nr:hypothetical protein HELRODRAFT_156957 [Helobdella robusta]ESO04656.1 hypothetical protein HELRODRAFT_156957 [Helobdella robusta]